MPTADVDTALPQLSDEQERGIEFCVANYKSGLIALAGPAGSGKTTLIKKLRTLIPDTVTVAAMTNKAAYVLRTKGIEDAVTLHQAAMRPKFRPPMDRLGAFLEQAPFFETKNEDANRSVDGDWYQLRSEVPFERDRRSNIQTVYTMQRQRFASRVVSSDDVAVQASNGLQKEAAPRVFRALKLNREISAGGSKHEKRRALL